MDINALCREIAEETMDADLELLELEKQYEFLTYAEFSADLDAEFYGVAGKQQLTKLVKYAG